jgi:hypothetical protein
MNHAEMSATPQPLSLPARLTFPRLLRPSLTDFFFIAIIFWLFLSDPGGWDRLLMDGDVGLHTRVGDYILDTGAVPKTDPFSFTRHGDRWFVFQWLSEVGFAELNRWAGLKGILLLCAAMTALTYTTLLRDMVRRGVHGLAALLLALMIANASSIHLHARPHLFTILFFVFAHYLIARDRERPSNRIWLLIPLAIVWCNTHSGFPVLLLALGLLAAGQAIARDWAGVKRYGLVTAACAVATLANPNGLELYRHMSRFLGNAWLMQNIHEYQSPVFRGEPMYYYLLFLLAACVCVWPLAERRRYPECLWILAFAAMSLQSARHIPLFLVVAASAIGLVATEKLAAIHTATELGAKVTSKLAAVSVWSAAFLVAVAAWSSPASWPADLSRKYFPRDMVHDQAELLASTRVFSTDQWGDYLLWVNYPRQQVFIDGRSDFYQDELGKEYVAVLNAAHNWRDILEKYGVGTLLIPPDVPLAEFARVDSAWRVVSRDDVAILLTRR